MIVIAQAVHIFACRTLRVSIFEQGMLTNYFTLGAFLIALFLGVFIVYTPGIQTIVMAYNPPSLIMLFGSLIAIVAILGYTEVRKLLIRRRCGMKMFLNF